MKLTRAAAIVTAPLMVMAFTACGGGDDGDSSSGETAEAAEETGLDVYIKLEGGYSENALTYCPRPADADDTAVALWGESKKLKVRVLNGETDELIINGFAEQKSEYPTYEDWVKGLGSDQGCTIYVAFNDVPRDLNFYTIQADLNESNFNDPGGQEANLVYSNDELVADNWEVQARIS